VEVARVEFPPVRERVLAHACLEKVNEARLDPRVFLAEVDVLVQRQRHVVHPPPRTVRIHHGQHLLLGMVKSQPMLGAVVLSPSAKGVNPERGLGLHMVVH